SGVNPISPAVGDFNGDGIQDLAVANYGNNNVTVFLGNGNGTFGSALIFPAGSLPTAVAVGDFNRDRVPDLAVANSSSTSVSVLLGNGSGPTTARPVLSPGSGTYDSPLQVTITDSTPGATIYYSTDGSTPTPSSTQYTGPITL